ncbi:YfiR family protein, partial [Verrucomicrobia bacterium]|nr:YfiR family protein [Verrucomicrobiota bacterium]
WTASTKFFMENVGLKEKPILTVGESEDFVVNGGVISIIKENDHLALLTNPDAAKNCQLFLSSNLVKLSRQVSTRKDK